MLIAKSQPALNTFAKYAKTELYPPTGKDIPAIKTAAGNLLNSLKTGSSWTNFFFSIINHDDQQDFDRVAFFDFDTMFAFFLMESTPIVNLSSFSYFPAFSRFCATGAFLNLTVREAALNTAIAVEVACWFYVGEILGRGSLIGYNV